MKKLLFLAIALFVASPANAQVDLGTSASATNPQRTGDATTGVFSPASDTVSVGSGGTEMMRVNGTGVGIGTTSPQALLDVNGVFRVTGAGTPSSGAGIEEFYSGGVGYIFPYDRTGGTGKDLILGAAGGGLTIKAVGNVGIETASPLAGLDVQNAITSASGVAYGGRYQQTLTASANNDALTALYINPTFTDGSYTGVANNGLIVAAGNVGIGTSAPSKPLDIESNFTTTQIIKAAGTGSYAEVFMLAERGTLASPTATQSADILGRTTFGGYNGSTSTGNLAGVWGRAAENFTSSSNGSQVEIWTTNIGSTTTTERMIVNPAGNVGIGTTSPQATLDVNGFARLALNSSAPATCSASNEGAIALTHLAQMCVCDTTPAWHVLNTSTACSW